MKSPLQIPCQDKPITAIDFRFEGPPPYEAPYNSFNNGSMFTALIPQTNDLLIYHGYMKDPETMDVQKAVQMGYVNPGLKTHAPAQPNPNTPKMQYFHVPDYWYVRAELLSGNDVIKPALGDVSGERQKFLYGQ